MLVTVQSPSRLNTMALPATAGGAHWIRDALGRDLVFAEGAEGRWTIEPAEGLAIRGLAPDARPMLISSETAQP